MIPIEQILIGTSGLLLLAVLASKASAKLGVPALLLFLLIGMLAGSEGPGGIPFDDARLTQAVGVVALAFILFAGGLDTDWAAVSAVLWKGLSPSTIGVFVTAFLVGLVRPSRAGILVASGIASWFDCLVNGRRRRFLCAPVSRNQPEGRYKGRY